jgi:hypothetical protein
MNRQDAAYELAQDHFRCDEGLERIFHIADGEDAGPIKLLEVNRDTIPLGIMPLNFGPSPGRPYPYTLVEITPDEHEMLRNSGLRLPDGWVIAKEIPRENDAITG